MSSPIERQAFFTERISRERRTEKLLHRNIEKGNILQSPHVFRPNLYNSGNLQFVSEKISAPQRNLGSHVETNTNTCEDTKQALVLTTIEPIKKFELPLTSSQEIGWFAKNNPLCEFRQDSRVNHPLRYSELSRYMSKYWRYYPSGAQKITSGPNL